MDIEYFESLIQRDVKIAHIIRNETEIYKGNRIFLIDNDGKEKEVKQIPNIVFKFKGSNSLIKIHESAQIQSATFEVGEGCFIYIDKFFRVRQRLYANLSNKNNTLYIGKSSNIGDAIIYAGDDPDLEVIIGSYFLSAYNLILRTSDGHTIYDRETKKVINVSNFGVHISDHVWCGLNVTVIKDVVIPNNCVIGACSLVCKGKFNPHTVIAGMPAKPIKSNISWSSCSISNFINQMHNE